MVMKALGRNEVEFSEAKGEGQCGPKVQNDATNEVGDQIISLMNNNKTLLCSKSHEKPLGSFK